MNTRIQAKTYKSTKMRTSVGRLITLALGLAVALIIVLILVNCSTMQSRKSFGYWRTQAKTKVTSQSVVAVMNWYAYL